MTRFRLREPFYMRRPRDVPADTPWVFIKYADVNALSSFLYQEQDEIKQRLFKYADGSDGYEVHLFILFDPSEGPVLFMWVPGMS